MFRNTMKRWVRVEYVDQRFQFDQLRIYFMIFFEECFVVDNDSLYDRVQLNECRSLRTVDVHCGQCHRSKMDMSRLDRCGHFWYVHGSFVRCTCIEFCACRQFWWNYKNKVYLETFLINWKPFFNRCAIGTSMSKSKLAFDDFSARLTSSSRLRHKL